jgi:hypothetical protein
LTDTIEELTLRRLIVTIVRMRVRIPILLAAIFIFFAADNVTAENPRETTLATSAPVPQVIAPPAQLGLSPFY